MIYVVEVLDLKYIKIGYSSNDTVEPRISQLQTGNPFKINPVICKPGTLIQEQELHKAMVAAFGSCQIPIPPNEWYPGKNDISKFMMLELRAGGVNAALAWLDKYNGNIYRSSKKPEADQEVKKVWPRLSRRLERAIGDCGNDQKVARKFKKCKGRGVSHL